MANVDGAGMGHLSIAVLTVSDTRTRENDTSGDYLVQALQEEGHSTAARAIVRDDIYALRSLRG
jgi:molybdenum cofactor biosynthesis protein B